MPPRRCEEGRACPCLSLHQSVSGTYTESNRPKEGGRRNASEEEEGRACPCLSLHQRVSGSQPQAVGYALQGVIWL